jgi:hypothetical protein
MMVVRLFAAAVATLHACCAAAAEPVLNLPFIGGSGRARYNGGREQTMSTCRSHLAWSAACLAVLLLGCAGVAAARDDKDHDRARQAVQAGEILPLKLILERVGIAHPGQVMDVELERSDGRWQYEIRILAAGGTMSRLLVDARDGSVVDRKAIGGDPDLTRAQAGARH